MGGGYPGCQKVKVAARYRWRTGFPSSLCTTANKTAALHGAAVLFLKSTTLDCEFSRHQQIRDKHGDGGYKGDQHKHRYHYQIHRQHCLDDIFYPDFSDGTTHKEG